MPRQTLLLIRHAEKPHDGVQGVDVAGAQDSRSLTPRGWQRAGIWTELLAPTLGGAGGLPTPTAIVASAPASHHELSPDSGGSKSRRPLETVAALADKLGIEIDLRFSKGEEAALAAAIGAMSGVVLVCWQHENIGDIARALVPAPAGVPDGWPDDRFNIVFQFTRANGQADAWTFRQFAPVLLKGDSPEPI